MARGAAHDGPAGRSWPVRRGRPPWDGCRPGDGRGPVSRLAGLSRPGQATATGLAGRSRRGRRGTAVSACWSRIGGARRRGPRAANQRCWWPATGASRRRAPARGAVPPCLHPAFPRGPGQTSAQLPHPRTGAGRPVDPESPSRERILLRASHSAVSPCRTSARARRAGRPLPGAPAGYGKGLRRGGPGRPGYGKGLRRGAQDGHDGPYCMLRFAVLGAGRYPYQTSMRISMPACLALR